MNNMFGSKDNFYWAVWQLGWYLPGPGAACTNVKYLTQVIKGQCFRIKRDDLKIGVTTHKKVNKVVLYEALVSIDAVQNWGFDIMHMPDKQFMLDVLHKFRPQNALFSFRAESE